MDEPLGALDKQLREQMQIEIKQHPRDDGRHRRLRHPRPERGADHVGPHRRVQRRHRPADRHARRALRAAGEQLRRPVHRREQPCCPAPSRRSDGDLPRHAGWRRRRRPHWRSTWLGRRARRPSLSVRPERDRNHPRTAPPASEPNRLPAKVQKTIYLGDHALRRAATVAGNGEFIVKLQPGTHVDSWAMSIWPGLEDGIRHLRPRTAWPSIPSGSGHGIASDGPTLTGTT